MNNIAQKCRHGYERGGCFTCRVDDSAKTVVNEQGERVICLGQAAVVENLNLPDVIRNNPDVDGA